MFTHLISYFSNAKSTEPTPVALGDFLRPDAATIKRILALRAIVDKDKRNEIKKTLPAATISGAFSKRLASEITAYNGLLCIDFDAADNPGKSPEEMREMLAEFQEVAFAGISVGGKGVYAIIPTNCTDPGQHPRICDFMRTVLLQAGLFADPSCKDVCRLRFVSYDPAPHINPTPAIFDAVAYLERLKAQERQALRPTNMASPSDKTRYKVERYIEAIEGGCADVTSHYPDWLKLGFALASEFGSEGENYFHRASQFNPKYDYQNTAAKYAELLKNGSGRVQIGTFFKICNDNGINLRS